MGVISPPGVSIGERRTHRLAAAATTLFPDDAGTTCLTLPMKERAATLGRSSENRKSVSCDAALHCGKRNLRYLVIIALVALLLFFLYRLLRPYIKLGREFLSSIRHFQQIISNRVKPENQQPEKLVCCDTCSTWIPIGRALNPGSGNVVFCSTACLGGNKRQRQAG